MKPRPRFVKPGWLMGRLLADVSSALAATAKDIVLLVGDEDPRLSETTAKLPYFWNSSLVISLPIQAL
jgi:hypothetical protein